MCNCRSLWVLENLAKASAGLYNIIILGHTFAQLRSIWLG